MANNKNKKNNSINKKSIKKYPSNSFVMKALTIFGTLFLFLACLYLMNYFFVEQNHLKVNMSTDKKQEYMTFNGQEELMVTQKYVSDLNYSMRYDINKFSVFKYKDQDIYKFNQAEKILVVVEKALAPESCSKTNNNGEYTSCVIAVDNYTDEYYISSSGKTYKITVKTPNTSDSEENIIKRIDYMINSFAMTT